MRQDWTSCLLGDVITLKRGYDLPKRKRKTGTVPIISSSGMTGYHNEVKVKGPGVVTGRYGTLGEVFYITEDFWPLNTALYVQDFKGNDPRFISYFLQTLGFGRQNVAGAVPGVNRNALHMLPVVVPPLPTQRKIAAILAAYDDLIENNTRRIQILEEMARTLYREWFVHFRFPGHEAVDRGEVENRAVKVEVPRGWHFARLGDITTKIGSGATPRGGKSAYKETGITLIRSLNIYDYRFDESGLAFIDNEQAERLSNVAVQRNDILLNITGASVARCCMVRDRHLPARVNQHVAIIRVDPSLADPHYVLCSINSESYKAQLLTLAQGGATRDALTKGTISDFHILLPTPDLLEKFSAAVRNLFQLRESLEHKNVVLRQTRDLLLPRLVSGDIDVSGLEIEV